MMISTPQYLIHRAVRPGLVSPLVETPCGTLMRSARGSCGSPGRSAVDSRHPRRLCQRPEGAGGPSEAKANRRQGPVLAVSPAGALR